jgi:hypothetical protein
VPLDDTVATIARFADPVIGVPRRKRPEGQPSGGLPFGRILDPQRRPR